MTESPEMAARCYAVSQIPRGFDLTALHPYVSPNGAPLYWRIRANRPDGEKWIRPMHFNGAGYALGEPKHPPTGKPPYALDRIAANPAAVVWIVEGENCADALNNLSLVATTSGGATSANGADWSPLAGRDCIIWPDNDDPGQAYADDVTRALTGVDCRVGRIDVAQLGLVEKGDAVDWLALRPAATKDDIDGLQRLAATPYAAAPVEATTPQAPGFTPSKPIVQLLNGSAVTPEPIDWIWDGWLAGGKLEILGGSAGTGKTTLALAMAAIITTGGLWPDGTRAAIGDVLIWSGEDDVADSLIPRLIACGADLKRVHFVSGTTDATGKRAFNPSKDMAALAEAIAKLQNLRLLIVDPVVSAVVGDSHKNAEVRQSLQPLVDLGFKAGCAVLGITHFSKGTQGSAPLERITGSLAFGALPRVVMGTASPADPLSKRRLVRLKSNIGPDGDGFEYTLDRKPIPNHEGVVGQFVVWGSMIEGSASTLIGDIESPDKSDKADASALEGAKRFLIKLLADGAMEAKQVRKEARDAGIAWATARRAKGDLGIEPYKGGFGATGFWYWKLPGTDDGLEDGPKMLNTSKDAHMENVSILSKDEHLSGPQPSEDDELEEIAL